VDTALGLIGIALFIVGVLALSATVTYAVIWADGAIRRRMGRAPAA
jgi:hypothetical protein